MSRTGIITTYLISRLLVRSGFLDIYPERKVLTAIERGITIAPTKTQGPKRKTASNFVEKRVVV